MIRSACFTAAVLATLSLSACVTGSMHTVTCPNTDINVSVPRSIFLHGEDQDIQAACQRAIAAEIDRERADATAQISPPVPAPVTAPARPATAPAPTLATSPQMSVAWTQAVAGWLRAHLVYPEEARRRGEEGNVLVRFTVEPSGSVVSVAVVRSSGSPWLDAAAEAMLRGATLPPFAPFMRQASVTVNAPIRYALEGGSTQADGYYLIAVVTLHGVDQGSYTPIAHAEGRATCMMLRKQMLVHPVLGVWPPYASRWTCMTDAQWFTLWTTLRPAPGQSK